jgi:hypothetical protein
VHKLIIGSLLVVAAVFFVFGSDQVVDFFRPVPEKCNHIAIRLAHPVSPDEYGEIMRQSVKACKADAYR